MAIEDDESHSYTPTHRVRHIVSLHVRNFSSRDKGTGTTALHHLSLGLSTSTDTQPVYLTTPSEPAVHADWTVDPRRIASGSRAGGGIVGQSRFAVSVWARRAGHGEETETDDTEAKWEYCWQTCVDTNALQPIAGGLTSPQLRRVPPNSLILGIAQQHARVTATQTDPAQAARKVATGQANPRATGTRVKYFLVVPPRRSRGRLPDNTLEEDREIASERSASEDESEGEQGYDSETAFELSSHSISARPGLNRRRSSSRTVRALKKGRRRKESIGASANANAGATQRQQWLLDREREREVLERSKWETTMLGSYTCEALQEIVSLQLQLFQESSAVRDERSAIDRVLQDPSSRFALSRRISSLQGNLSHLNTLQSTQDDAIRATQASITSRKQDLSRRRARLDYVRRSLIRPDHTAETQQTQSEIARLSIEVHNRRAHLLDALSFIYPIRLLSGADLLFSICGLALPNSPADTAQSHGVDEDEVAAALGFTAQLVLLLSSYLDTSLHYDIATAGSKAMIRDGISMMSGPRGFPLYSKGAEQYRFEYAVFLLNKNIEQLMNAHNLPVLDLRHILPNLNNLILTLSSRVVHTAPAVTSNPPPHRKGYKMVGKGEIVLPSGRDKEVQSVDEPTVTSTPTATTTTPTPSVALSWTASLFGRSRSQRAAEGNGSGAVS